MLEQCIAKLIGANDEQLGMLGRVANAAGFAIADPGKAFEPPLSFFLMHIELSTSVKKAALEVIRHSPIDSICFAPVIVIADDCDPEIVLSLVHFGFDDVICLPEKRQILAQRFERQLLTSHTYFRTETYLGPDRRRMERETEVFNRRGNGNFWHERLLIRRDVHAGVKVLQRTFVGAATHPQMEVASLRGQGAALQAS